MRGNKHVVFHDRIFLLSAVLLGGCPAGDDDQIMRDAGTTDSVCAAAEDAGTGGIVIDCNPIDGSRCDIRKNLSCIWDVATDDGICECLENPQPFDAACGEDRGACEPGHTCLFLAGDDLPRCYKVCDVPNNEGCASASAVEPSTAFACAPLRRANNELTETYGVCFGVGVTCDPFNDGCTGGDTCGLVGRVPACVIPGSRLLGQSCETEACAAGGLCVALVDAAGTELGPICYAPCKLDDPFCAAGQCVDVGLTIGLCYDP